ncbi:hypothetical protein PCE1_004559 [Barthelona sp. PCE]
MVRSYPPGTKVPVRRNGFNRPLAGLQIVAWILMVVFGFCYVFFYIAVLPYPLSTWFLWVGVFFYVCMWISNIICTAINPADRNLDRSRKFIIWQPLQRGKRTISRKNFCNYCNTTVRKESKHCRICNKCTERFDHHCVWLNNCIGNANYKAFFVFLSISSFLVLVFLFLGVYLVCSWLFKLQPVYNEYLRHSSPIFLLIGITVVTVISIPCCVLILQLLFFHINLIAHNMTTFEFIVKQRMAKQKAELGRHRMPKVRRTSRAVVISRNPTSDDEEEVEVKPTTPANEERLRAPTQEEANEGSACVPRCIDNATNRPSRPANSQRISNQYLNSEEEVKTNETIVAASTDTETESERSETPTKEVDHTDLTQMNEIPTTSSVISPIIPPENVVISINDENLEFNSLTLVSPRSETESPLSNEFNINRIID